MGSWEETNKQLFSSWDLDRILQMERIHEHGVNYLVEFVKKLNIFSNDPFHVLEIGCGSGYALLALARIYLEFSKRVELVGIDISPSMIAIANEKAKRFFNTKNISENSNNSAIKFIEGDFLQIPPDMGKFDLVFSLESFYYLRDLHAALAKIRSILVPKGFLLILVEDEMLASGNDVIDKERLAYLASQVNISTLHFLSIEMYLFILEESGFSDIRVDYAPGFTIIVASASK